MSGNESLQKNPLSIDEEQRLISFFTILIQIDQHIRKISESHKDNIKEIQREA